jgi:hypothetical protein
MNSPQINPIGKRGDLQTETSLFLEIILQNTSLFLSKNGNAF